MRRGRTLSRSTRTRCGADAFSGTDSGHWRWPQSSDETPNSPARVALSSAFAYNAPTLGATVSAEILRKNFLAARTFLLPRKAESAIRGLRKICESYEIPASAARLLAKTALIDDRSGLAGFAVVEFTKRLARACHSRRSHLQRRDPASSSRPGLADATDLGKDS